MSPESACHKTSAHSSSPGTSAGRDGEVRAPHLSQLRLLRSAKPRLLFGLNSWGSLLLKPSQEALTGRRPLTLWECAIHSSPGIPHL